MSKIYESGEMYLETILVLKNRTGEVRSIDIAREMNISKPSVSRAVGILKKEHYIEIDKDGYITLTESGAAVAENIYERHCVLTKCLLMLGVDEQTASEDACKIEHHISDIAFTKIKEHIGKYSKE